MDHSTQGAYDASDFARNPGKYELFKTARIATAIPSAPQFKVGQVVSIKFFTIVPNVAVKSKPMTPVYQVSTDHHNEADFSHLFAQTLRDFTL